MPRIWTHFKFHLDKGGKVGLQLRNYIGLVWTYQLYDSAGQPYPGLTSY